jgi:pimeloyl-ACP methyl ester carboxylesterase
MYIERKKLMTMKQTKPRGVWQITRSILKWSMISLAGVMMLALLTEGLMKSLNTRNFPPPGKLYTVGEHQMHIWCEGSGEPVVLLDSGASMFSSGWRWVMPELAESTRVCAFDRSGLGWSEVSEPPYDGISAANELHALLQQADVRLPFIYVGHSLGGNLGEIYHHQYPEDLSALVMLEPANPGIFLQEMAEERGTGIVRGKEIADCGMRCVMMTAVSALGVFDLALSQIEVLNDPLFHPRGLAEYKARMNRTSTLKHLAQRGRYLTEIMFQSIDSQPYGDLPVAIFHSENSGELLGDHSSPQEMIEDREKGILAYGQAVASSTTPLGLTEISNANHLTMVMYEEPAKQVSARILEIWQWLQDQEKAGAGTSPAL